MITVTDHLDNQVTVPADIERIAVVGVWPLPSVLTIFFNSAEKIVGMPEASLTAAQNGLLGELYPEILNAKTDFINGDDVNLEELMLLEPDVVFYNAGKPRRRREADQRRVCGGGSVGQQVGLRLH